MCVTDLPGDWWHAVSLWRTGDPMDAVTLCGYRILWWGRIGKIMQFVAGLTVILDLIGPDRLRALGKSAKERLSRVSLRSLPLLVKGGYSSGQKILVWFAGVPAWLLGFGVPYYWYQVKVLHWDKEFAFWAALYIAMSMVLIILPSRISNGLMLWGLSTTIVLVVGSIKYGVLTSWLAWNEMPWWQQWIIGEDSSGLFGIGIVLSLLIAVLLFAVLAALFIAFLGLTYSIYLGVRPAEQVERL